ATLAERERLADALRSIGLEPLPSYTNFLCVPYERAQELYESLLERGLAVRPSPGALRITVHRPDADDRLVEALAGLVYVEWAASNPAVRVSVAAGDTGSPPGMAQPTGSYARRRGSVWVCPESQAAFVPCCGPRRRRSRRSESRRRCAQAG